MNHRPVCATCQMEMKPELNGVGVLDMADFGPYALWEADLWKCPSCGLEILVGFGRLPIVHHYDASFSALLNLWTEKRKVYQCKTR